MSNSNQVNRYGLDFLRREHVLDEVGSTKNPRFDTSTASRSQHDDESDGRRGSEYVDTEALAAAVAHKPDLEKQFDVIHFLQAHRSAGWMPPQVIYQRTGIDLEEDVTVARMLSNNPKIQVETVPDPENPSLTIDTYAYQAKYNHVRDRKTLLAQINRCKNGVPVRDLMDSYDTVSKDLDALVCAGDVLALYNTEDKDRVLFPRGEPFLVELDGILSPPPVDEKNQTTKPESAATPDKKEADPSQTTPVKDEPMATEDGGSSSKVTPEKASSPDKNSGNGENPVSPPPPLGEGAMPPRPASPPRPVYCVETDSDPTTQLRRGEAVQIGGTWFRVSSAVKEGPLKDQPARATAPLSVVSRKDLSKRNEIDGYIRPFTTTILPADAALPPSAIDNLRQAKRARETLARLAHGYGRAGGAASQLLGGNAHAANPVALAQSLGASTHPGRKRPGGGGGLSGQQTQARSRAAAQEHLEKLKKAALDPFLSLYSHPRRHGCTKDVRELYLKTRSRVPSNDPDLKAALVKHKLLDASEELRRPRLQKKANVDNDGKPKKRRYYERKNQRMTNTHLEGTEIGAILLRASEKQQQGQQVGDGGM